MLVKNFLKNTENSVLAILRSSVFIICTGFLLFFFAFTIPDSYTALIKPFQNSFTTSYILFFIVSIFLYYFCIPLHFAKWIYKIKPRDLGLCFPTNAKESAILILIALALLIPVILFFSSTPQIQHYYAFKEMPTGKFLFMIFLVTPLYYVFEEFFFRGFLFLNLKNKIGWNSLWITDLIYIISHLTKPLLEILLSFPAGIILALITWRTKSLIPAIVIHYCLGLTMVLSVNFIYVPLHLF